MKKLFIKDWILYKEEANNGGRAPEEVKEVLPKSERESHTPLITKTDSGYRMEIPGYPNDEDHFVNLFEIQIDDMTYTKDVQPTEQAFLEITTQPGKVVVGRFFCNQHGLFQKEEK